MDVGLARSGQQHTARLLAYYLGMNYAWAVTVVELAMPDETERKSSDSSQNQNFHGLHGTAVLSKCRLSGATIFRTPIGEHFSRGVGGHASDREMYFGGHMIVLVRVAVNDNSVVIGSAHEVRGFTQEIKDYIGTSPAIIAADPESSACRDGELIVAESDLQKVNSPASCVRCDAICSNMKVARNKYVMKPRTSRYGLNVTLGENTLIKTTFELSKR
eukprot:TRINITY_DN66000_c0_g1_i1.p1 TRINITY_DN66000_c0_g1~~TRINITY_DN66000_c0_g1_i1.p1  ORF type:complete len:224 (-),score=9.76 TRINITY_DN66000_c0_g1_i1:198-848(-)